MTGIIINPYSLLTGAGAAFSSDVVVGGTLGNVSSLSGQTAINKYLVGAQLLAGPFTLARLTFMSGNSANALINDTFIGLAPTSGTAWNFDAAAKARVTFSGSSSLQMLTGRLTYISDAISLGFTIDRTRALVVAMNCAPAAATSLTNRTGLGPNYLQYRKAGFQEAEEAVKTTGYSTTSGSSLTLTLIEGAA